MSNLPALFKKNVERRLAENKAAGKSPGNNVEMAAVLRVSPQSVSKALSGKDVRLSTVQVYAKALGTTPARLLAGPEDQPDIMDSVQAIQDWLRQVKAAADDPDELIRLALETKKK